MLGWHRAKRKYIQVKALDDAQTCHSDNASQIGWSVLVWLEESRQMYPPNHSMIHIYPVEEGAPVGELLTVLPSAVCICLLVSMKLRRNVLHFTAYHNTENDTYLSNSQTSLHITFMQANIEDIVITHFEYAEKGNPMKET